MRYTLLILIILLSCNACQDNVQPKPKAYLALEYPTPKYTKLKTNCPYVFEVNTLTKIKTSRTGNPCWLNIEYPEMKGTIFITYRRVDNNLRSLLIDAQKLPLEHTSKADEIEVDTYTNEKHNVFGNFYEVKGNAASQAQFYVTDSTKNFITGSIYFNARPNFDSIIPAANYLKKDIRHLMESVRWKE